MNKLVYTWHIGDTTLKAFIRKNGFRGQCNYCKDSIKKEIIDISDLAEMIEESIFQLYDDAGNCLPNESAEGSYQGTIYVTRDLFEDNMK